MGSVSIVVACDVTVLETILMKQGIRDHMAGFGDFGLESGSYRSWLFTELKRADGLPTG